jgi:hypothetical protein
MLADPHRQPSAMLAGLTSGKAPSNDGHRLTTVVHQLIVHRQRLSRALCGWLVAVLLLTQMLTAAYACPQMEPATWAGDKAAADCMGALPASMDPDQPLLCKAHCEAGGQSVNSQVGVLDAPPAAAVCTALAGVVRVAEAARLAATMPTSLAHGPPAGAPPLYLSLLVLRN